MLRRSRCVLIFLSNTHAWYVIRDESVIERKAGLKEKINGNRCRRFKCFPVILSFGVISCEDGAVLPPPPIPRSVGVDASNCSVIEGRKEGRKERMGSFIAPPWLLNVKAGGTL